MQKKATYRIAARRTALVRKAAQILERTALERFGEALAEGPEAGLVLDVRPGIGTEGFAIEDCGGAVRIAGNDERGLLYGVGKHLRDRAWRGTSVPDKPVRGMYFATHFHNFYHDAPIEKVQRYVEDLALWGCNALQVWFDMHHYASINDPEAQAMVRRLRTVLQTAGSVGITASLGGLANEAFSSSPAELRADWTDGHDGYHHPPGGHYHVEICPSRPGGLDLILQYRRQMLEAFAGVNVGYYWLWPYDQGGCTCSKCAPWGVNGYLQCSEALVKLVREMCPQARIVLSTWYFDHFTDGEWEGLARWFASRKPDWVDYLMADDYGSFPDYPLKHGVPGGRPTLSFPEISMCLMWPWGGFGANPRIAHWQAYWDGVGSRLAGGFPYSEGIYEDLNKVLQLQLWWDGRRAARDIAVEYAASEFAPEHAEEIVKAMASMEEALEHSVSHRAAAESLRGAGAPNGAGDLPRLYAMPRVREPGRYAEPLRRIDGALPAGARRAWRWRVLWLRASLDEELLRSDGRPTDRSEGYFDELAAIYHAESAEQPVLPPSRRVLSRLR
jgi:hypothetical protein